MGRLIAKAPSCFLASKWLSVSMHKSASGKQNNEVVMPLALKENASPACSSWQHDATNEIYKAMSTANGSK